MKHFGISPKTRNYDFEKKYKLLSANGQFILSNKPGRLGGNGKAMIYGTLECSSANRALSKGYVSHRVFLATENDAVKVGYRPCGNCMREKYKIWKTTKNAVDIEVRKKT